MENPVFTSEFDLNITALQLVHKHSLASGFFMTGYARGRSMDGLVYCLSGKALFDFGGQTLTLTAGQLLYLPARGAYIIRVPEGEPFLHFTANFTAAAEGLRVPRLAPGELPHVTSPRNAELYTPRFERLLSAWQAKQSGYLLLARSILYEILHLYFTDAGVAYRKSDDYARIRPAKHYIDRHFAEPITVGELAALCGISETHFRRLFTALLGLSPTAYRLNRQMMYAKDYLLTGHYTVGEAAALAGFENLNYFSRIFKAREGKTPTEFLQGSLSKELLQAHKSTGTADPHA